MCGMCIISVDFSMCGHWCVWHIGGSCVVRLVFLCEIYVLCMCGLGVTFVQCVVVCTGECGDIA